MLFRSILGTPQSVRRFDSTTVRDFYHAVYAPANVLVNEIVSLLRDRSRLAAMSEAARRFAHPDAAAKIASLAARAAGVQSQHAVA